MLGVLTATGINSHYPALAHRACSGIEKVCGAVAQLGERRVRNAKVRGSIPLGSTTFGTALTHQQDRAANPLQTAAIGLVLLQDQICTEHHQRSPLPLRELA